jgi:subtilisin-like proprotein convertase family protein
MLLVPFSARTSLTLHAAIARIAAACLATAAFAGPALATPTTMAVQGAIVASGGGPATDGSYVASFALFGTQFGGKPVWSEGPLVLAVKGGMFQVVLGQKSPLDAKLFAGLAQGWLEVKIEPDPELPRVQLHGVPYAHRAALADDLACSGCVGATDLDPAVLADYAKKDGLAKVAVTGAYADLAGGPDLSPYAKSADLGAYAKMGELADVAKSGAYGDLKSAPVVPKVGAACGTGLVLRGFKQDGAYDCVVAMDPNALPPDGLDDISNKLLTNQFTDAAVLPKPVPIKDNNVPVGTTLLLEVPDFGIAQGLTVAIEVENSDLGKLSMSLTDPANKTHLLCDPCGKKDDKALKFSFPDKNPVKVGDLGAWIGQNPKGTWKLFVQDSGYFNNADDGQVKAWSINVQTLSTKKVAATGVFSVQGAFQFPLLDSAPVACSDATVGYSYLAKKDLAIYICNGKDWFPLAIKPVGTQENPGASCKDILTKQPASKDGIYWIAPPGAGAAVQAYCDMTNNGGGWTLAARMKQGSWCHINDAKVGTLTAPGQNDCAKLSDAQIRALYTDQFWLSCGSASPHRFGKINAIQNFNTTSGTGDKVMTWSETYGGQTYSGTDNTCCNFGDHNYHNPHIIYSIAKGYNGGNYTADWSGCYNSQHGWHQNGYLFVR